MTVARPFLRVASIARVPLREGAEESLKKPVFSALCAQLGHADVGRDRRGTSAEAGDSPGTSAAGMLVELSFGD
jgi:hypothetical protein